MTEFKNNSELLRLLVKWWKQLFVIGSLAFGLSLIFSSSFVITPKYRSFAILYPANIIPMGTETPTEQMLQVLESDFVRDSVSVLYHLSEDYGIDLSKPSSRNALLKEYQSNVTFRKTEYESVVVEVLDTDPVQARDMVNSIIYFFNRKERILQVEKSMELAKILNEQVSKKKAEMDSMESILTGIRMEYGLLDYGLQTEYATKSYLEVVSSPGSKARADEIVTILDALKEKGGEFVALNEHLWRIRGGYNDLKEQYETAVRDVEKSLTYCNIISNPEIPDKKAYPVRWLIVAASTLGALLFGLVVLSLVENLRGIKTIR